MGDIQHIVYITAIIIYTKTTLLIKVLLNLMVDFSLCLLCIATMGRDTPQYRAVLDNLDRLVRNIRGLPEAENHLQRQFREKEWIDITSQVNADELTSLALTKIEMNAENYKVFIDMLNSVTGLQEIVARIRRYHFKSVLICT